MNYGKALRIARAIAGLQQKEVASRTNLDPSYVSLIERGERTPSVKTIRVISQALGIPAHLFTLLASEPDDIQLSDPDEVREIGITLAKLLLSSPIENEHSF
jgi:transcriptional regulator with XRE-family HTH domain